MYRKVKLFVSLKYDRPVARSHRAGQLLHHGRGAEEGQRAAQVLELGVNVERLALHVHRAARDREHRDTGQANDEARGGALDVEHPLGDVGAVPLGIKLLRLVRGAVREDTR